MFSEKPVLIICNTTSSELYLGLLLKRIWYKPTFAKTAEEAVDLAANNSFEILILDDDISEQDLQKSIGLLRTDPAAKNLPLVLFTTKRETEKRRLDQGCSAVVEKPVNLALAFGVLGNFSGEPRKAPRIPVRFKVRVKEGASEKEFTCVNLSEGGMRLQAPMALSEGSLVRAAFSLPRNAKSIVLEAVVVRAELLEDTNDAEAGIGLRFNNLSPDVRQAIRNFIQEEIVENL